MRRKFVESSGFSRDRRSLESSGELSESDIMVMEQSILKDPEVGDLVKETGGMRKVRVAQKSVGRGKSGGVRVYYFDLPSVSVTHLIAIFGKREKDDLTKAQRQALKRMAAELKKEAKA